MSLAEKRSSPHLPDPSIWPFVAGAAALMAAVALVWWSRDRSNGLAGAAMGGALVAVLVAVTGWAAEDSRMRTKSAQGEVGSRVEQVVVFQLARDHPGAEPLLAEIESLGAELRDLAGFEDLRILRTPVGHNDQVIVETTWANEGGRAAFDATRRTFLDLLMTHGESVTAGSVQAFDALVLAETKNLVPRLNIAVAALFAGALAVGGIAVATGVAMFEGNGEPEAVPGPGRTPTPAGEFAGTIVAKSIKFVQTRFSLPPDTEVTLIMDNQDKGIPHNIAFYQSEKPGDGGFLGGCVSGCADGSGPLRTEIEPGLVTQTFTFRTPGVGKYGYLCEVHPTTMRGVMEIVEGAMPPMVMP